MMNPNLQNNPMGNLMLAMMMQQAVNQQPKQHVTSTNKGESSGQSDLNELKELVNKYKNVMSVEDKNRMDFLIDALSKKL